MRSFLAIDIGAGSGRHILGKLDEDRLVLREVYRFDNGISLKNDTLCWDIPYIFEQVIHGIRECIEGYTIPDSIAIDTWGVDFVLLDERGSIIGDSVAYRDPRTEGMDIEVEKTLAFTELYSRTGIQKMLLNSIYQLMAIKINTPEQLSKAKNLLMIPDYLNYLLTGRMLTEYTNASTTSLVDIKTRGWDKPLIDMLGFPEHIFGDITSPGVIIGKPTKAVAAKLGASPNILLVATHDTGSAFIAIPSEGEDSVIISSGTWSLLGIESKIAIVTEEGEKANFTNEGGYEGTYRYLKNIMGLWMLQSVRRDTNMKYSYSEIAEMARKGSSYHEIVDVNDHTFIAPISMLEALNYVLTENKKPLPKNIEESLYCIYHSLAVCYRDSIHNLEGITGRIFSQINIIGGGCQDEYLNQLTADVTGLKVVAGPVEATTIGNLLVQLITRGEIKNLSEARRIVKNSFSVKEYLPSYNV